MIGKVRQPQKGTDTVYQYLSNAGDLFPHIFGSEAGEEGTLVTFTGSQRRIRDASAPKNELEDVRQRFWQYPNKAEEAAEHLLSEARRQRDAYFGVHLYREPLNRRADNAVPFVRALWLDEDEGHYPEVGPEPTAIVYSSGERRHLYWRLKYPVATRWAVAMNRRLAAFSSGDFGKAAAATVLRAPGTANYKRWPQVDAVAGKLTGATEWDPEIMDQAIPMIPETNLAKPSPFDDLPYDGPEMALEEFLAGEATEILAEISDGLGRKYAIVCPWVAEHTGGDRSGTRVGQRIDGATLGALWFHCDHAHCVGRTWADFRKMVERTRFAQAAPPGYTGSNLNVRIRYGR